MNENYLAVDKSCAFVFGKLGKNYGCCRNFGFFDYGSLRSLNFFGSCENYFYYNLFFSRCFSLFDNRLFDYFGSNLRLYDRLFLFLYDEGGFFNLFGFCNNFRFLDNFRSNLFNCRLFDYFGGNLFYYGFLNCFFSKLLSELLNSGFLNCFFDSLFCCRFFDCFLDSLFDYRLFNRLFGSLFSNLFNDLFNGLFDGLFDSCGRFGLECDFLGNLFDGLECNLGYDFLSSGFCNNRCILILYIHSNVYRGVGACYDCDRSHNGYFYYVVNHLNRRNDNSFSFNCYRLNRFNLNRFSLNRYCFNHGFLILGDLHSLGICCGRISRILNLLLFCNCNYRSRCCYMSRCCYRCCNRCRRCYRCLCNCNHRLFYNNRGLSNSCGFSVSCRFSNGFRLSGNCFLTAYSNYRSFSYSSCTQRCYELRSNVLDRSYVGCCNYNGSCLMRDCYRLDNRHCRLNGSCRTGDCYRFSYRSCYRFCYRSCYRSCYRFCYRSYRSCYRFCYRSYRSKRFCYRCNGLGSRCCYYLFCNACNYRCRFLLLSLRLVCLGLISLNRSLGNDCYSLGRYLIRCRLGYNSLCDRLDCDNGCFANLDFC